MTKRNKSTLKSNASTLFVDNTMGDIEANEVLDEVNDWMDSLANVESVEEGYVPVVSKEDGVMSQGSIKDNGDSVEFETTPVFPGNKVEVGNTTVNNPGKDLTLANKGSDVQLDFPNREFTLAEGSASTKVKNRSKIQTSVFNSRSTEIISTSDQSYSFLRPTSATIYELITSSNNGSGNFYIEVYEGKDTSVSPYWVSHTKKQITNGNVFTLNSSNTLHDLKITPTDPSNNARTSHPLDIYADVEYTVRLVSVGGNITIEGTTTTQADVDNPSLPYTVVGQKVPTLSFKEQPFTEDRVWTNSDTGEDGELTEVISDVVSNTLVAGSNVSLDKDDDNNTVTINSSAKASIDNGSIEPVKANVSTIERKRLWREGFYSAQITRGTRFPQGANPNDMHVFDLDVASGLSWREYNYVTTETTQLTSARKGDVGMYGQVGPAEFYWFRVGNMDSVGVSDWAKSGDTSQIPASKLRNAMSGISGNFIKPISEYLSDSIDTTPFRIYRGDGRLAADSDNAYAGDYLFVIKDLSSLIPEENRTGDNSPTSIHLFITDKDGVADLVHVFDNFSYKEGSFIAPFVIDSSEQARTLQDVVTTPGRIRFQFRFRTDLNVNVLSAPVYSMPIVPGLLPEVRTIGDRLNLDSKGVLSVIPETQHAHISDFSLANEEGVPITYFDNYAPLTGRHDIIMNIQNAVNVSNLSLTLNGTPVSIALTPFKEGFNKFTITVPQAATAAVAAANNVPEFVLSYRPFKDATPVNLSHSIDVRGFGFTFPTERVTANSNLFLNNATVFAANVGKVLQLTSAIPVEYQMPPWQNSSRWSSSTNDAFGFVNLVTQPNITQTITTPEGSYFEYLDGVQATSIVNHSGDKGVAVFRDPSTTGRFFVRDLPGSAPTALHIAPNRGLQFDDQHRLELTDEALEGAFRIGVHPFSWVRGSTEATTIYIEIPFAKPSDDRLDNVDKIRVTFNGFAPQDVDFQPSSTRSGLVAVNISALNVGTISGNIESTDNVVDIGVALHATGGGAIEGDNLVLSETIRIPVILAPRLVLQEAVNGSSTAGVTSLILPTNYTDYERLCVTFWDTTRNVAGVEEVSTKVIAAQSTNQTIGLISWTRATRQISYFAGSGRIIFAELCN